MKAIHAIRPLVRALVLTLAVLLLGVPLGRAADGNPPDRMTYQGYLVDSGGNPLGNTNTGPKNYDVIFRIYTDQSAGTRVWTEQQTITVDRGYFSVLLGEGGAYNSETRPTLSSLFTNQVNASDRFIEITVAGIGTGGANATILPRMRLLTSPYAFLARNSINAISAVSAVSATTAVTATSATTATTATRATSAVNAGLATNAFSLVNKFGDEVAYVTTTNVHVNGNVYATKVSATILTGYGTTPLGGIIMWSGTNVPSGWALCDGSTVNGQITPDLRGRFVLASGNSPVLANRTLGTIGGEEKHLLTEEEMPTHSHGYTTKSSDTGYIAARSGDDNLWYSTTSGTTTIAGGDAAHNIMPPYYVLAFIMRVY